MNNNALAKLEGAKKLLIEAKTLQEVKKLSNLADAAKAYAKQAHLGLELVNHASEITLRAQRKLGDMLKESPKNRGQLFRGPHQEPRGAIPKLLDIGLTKKESSISQQIASIPEQTFESHIRETKENGQELTISRLLRNTANERRQSSFSALKTPNLPKKKYRIIYADPPWQYGDSGLGSYGRAEIHYPTMSTDDLCCLDIKSITADSAVLFLWVTSPMVEDSLRVINAWGFKYKTSFVWDKIRHNFGHYNSVRHEFLFVCTKGSCLPDSKKLIDSVISIEKSPKHSEKPEAFRKIIEELYPHGKKLELFARKQTEGWDSFGNEL